MPHRLVTQTNPSFGYVLHIDVNEGATAQSANEMCLVAVAMMTLTLREEVEEDRLAVPLVVSTTR